MHSVQVLRFRVQGVSFLSSGTSFSSFRVLSDSFFFFECFVFDTTRFDGKPFDTRKVSGNLNSIFYV